MIIRGILEYSLGGQLCIRGFAPLGELARLSQPDESYQRAYIQERQEELQKYLKNNNYLFFSEIVLSLDLKHKLTYDGSSNELPLLQFKESSTRSFKSNIDGTELREKSVSYRNKSDIRNKTEIKLVEIILDDRQIGEGKRPFNRIDGNHRLSAVEDLNDENVSKKDCPFCIILSSSVEGVDGLILQQEGKKAERIIFNNINAKAVPLTMEQNLKAIILQDGVDGFDDEELKEKFDWATYAVRKLGIALISNLADVYPNLGQDFLNCPLTFSKKIIDIALTENVIVELDEEINKIKQALREVNQILGNENLTEISVDIVVACVFIQLSQMKLPIFINWLKRNHIFDLDQVHSKSLIKIYKKIKEVKSKQVFISMQFSPDTTPHYDAIKEAVQTINQEFGQEILLREIRIDQFNQGYSHNINDEILELIEDSGLLIADISHQNGNVYHEIGYLMGLNRGKGLGQKNFILIKNDSSPFDANRVGFNLTDIKQIRFTNTLRLKADLVEALKVYYQLA
ncbi:DNA sulfur modification protein DndB [Acinetobacter sp. 5862]|uniref:DNA sulfur modification protein DndB n=1 Tax=Acinetobacter sp. 5862 TaxID=2967169 RepID=UPI002112D64A|nr:DNA sulfur modification protein DndB [Acinetobacter sp. 5862]